MNQVIEKVKTLSKQPEFWLRFTAYAIPLAFLLYVLYWNFLPFGYSKTFVIDVGAEGDTNSSQEFYLEPSQDLSERKVAEDGTTYRELNGVAYAVFKPKAVLKDAEIAVEVEGEGVSIIPPVIDFDPESVEWDYEWDFTQGKTPSELGLMGNAFLFDGCMYFDGRSKLELPNSSNKFESGPFTVYAEWNPKDSQGYGQQIVGHYNWELWQNSDSVSFQVGRMDNAKGTAYILKYPISPNFFNIKHTAVAVYNPSENGYMELYVDGNFAGRTYLRASIIWTAYNGDKNLSLGWTPHNNEENAHFYGNICSMRISLNNILPPQTKSTFLIKKDDPTVVPLIAAFHATVSQVTLHVTSE